MRAVIERSATSKVALLTALIPPKSLWTSRIERIVAPLAPGAGAVAVAASLTEDHLLALAQRPLGPERHQQDQHQADEDEPQRGDLVGGEPQVGVAHPLQQGPEDDRSQHHAGEAGE